MTVCPVRDNVAPYPKNHSRIGWIGSGRHAGPSPKTGSRLRVCLSAVLCLAIALSAVPGTVFAADDAATARALAADGIAATCTLATDEIAPDLGANDAALLSTGFVRWKIVSAGRGFHSLGIKEDGTLWAWGLNSCGQLGDGTGGDGTNANDKNAPVQVGTDRWVAVSAGRNYSLGIKEDGTLWAWGLNSCGQLGDGTGGDGTNANDKNAPVQVGTDRWVAVSAGGSIDEVHSLGIKDDGSLWAWGRNGEGQLGDGTGGDETDANDKNAPVQVGTDRWRVVSAGNWHSLGIKEDGTLWAWGHSGWGRLGIGSSGGSNSKNAPAKIGADKWRTVSAGQNHSFGIKEDGTLWAWGVSSHGQLGIGASGDDKIERSPVPIGAETDRWRTASAGQLHSFGIKRDGTLWAWGVNSYGHLGDGTGGDETDANDKNAPVQVGAGAGRWITVSAGNAYSLGIKGDGSLWAWGSNSHGRLGIGVSGTSGNKNVPTKADGPPPLTRIFGTDRFATSIEASRANFGSADAVIIATGMGYADALSASALAGTLNAPLLLTRQDSLSPGVLGEIERLDATKAYIIGSEAAVSSAVEASLASAGLSVERVAGADRYATSAAIASRMAALESAAFAKKAFLARGDNFADGLAVSPLAYNNRYPVVLTRPTELPAPAATAITNLGIADITILGSEAAVSAGVEATVKRLGTSPTVRRVAGPDRYRTAQEIAKHALDNSLATKRFVGVATGLNFPDALAGGAAAGEREGILVLTAPDTLSVNWVGYLPGAYTGVRPDIQVYGGSNVVSESVFNTIKSMLVD